MNICLTRRSLASNTQHNIKSTDMKRALNIDFAANTRRGNNGNGFRNRPRPAQYNGLMPISGAAAKLALQSQDTTKMYPVICTILEFEPHPCVIYCTYDLQLQR
jgi:hypothetical protein